MDNKNPPSWDSLFQQAPEKPKEEPVVTAEPVPKHAPPKLAARSIKPHKLRPEMIIRQLLGVTDKIGELVVVAKIEDQTVLMASGDTSGVFLTIAGAILEQAGVQSLTTPSSSPGGKRA